jgi:protein SCO1/2
MKRLLALAGLLLCSGVVHADESASETPSILREVGIDQRLNNPVPLDLTFKNEQGEPVSVEQCMAGRPTILVLAYYRCPKLCSEVLNGLTDGLSKVDFKIGKEFNVIILSFDASEEPELAAAKKKVYVEKYGWPGAEKGWHFLTGDESSIVRLANAVGFRFRWDPFQKIFAHDSGIIFLTPQGRVSSYLFGVNYNPTQLRLSLMAASNNEIGSLVDHVLMACYRYDPRIGQYTSWVITWVRIGGAVTVLVLFGLMSYSWVREGRRRRAERMMAQARGASG